MHEGKTFGKPKMPKPQNPKMPAHLLSIPCPGPERPLKAATGRVALAVELAQLPGRHGRTRGRRRKNGLPARSSLPPHERPGWSFYWRGLGRPLGGGGGRGWLLGFTDAPDGRVCGGAHQVVGAFDHELHVGVVDGQRHALGGCGILPRGGGGETRLEAASPRPSRAMRKVFQ